MHWVLRWASGLRSSRTGLALHVPLGVLQTLCCLLSFPSSLLTAHSTHPVHTALTRETFGQSPGTHIRRWLCTGHWDGGRCRDMRPSALPGQLSFKADLVRWRPGHGLGQGRAILPGDLDQESRGRMWPGWGNKASARKTAWLAA